MKKIISLLLASAMLIIMLSSCGDNSLKYSAKLYFVNTDMTELVQETREITIPENLSVAECVVNEILTGPKNPEYKAIIPKAAKLNDVNVAGNLVIVDFSEEVYPETEADSLLLSTSILRTLTEITGITRVLITVDGGDFEISEGNSIGIMNKDDIVYDTTPEVKQQQFISLYFADESASELVEETRKITINEKEKIEMQVLKELLKGPENKDLNRTIPAETKILSVETKEQVCFVNLSQEFISRHTGGTMSEQLTIYSIVNTLTSLEGIEKVQFLIEGQKNESFIHMLINEPFVRDGSLIK